MSQHLHNQTWQNVINNNHQTRSHNQALPKQSRHINKQPDGYFSLDSEDDCCWDCQSLPLTVFLKTTLTFFTKVNNNFELELRSKTLACLFSSKFCQLDVQVLYVLFWRDDIAMDILNKLLKIQIFTFIVSPFPPCFSNWSVQTAHPPTPK